MYDGPFRINIQGFLGHFGEPESTSSALVKAWRIAVKEKIDSTAVLSDLYVYEETADANDPPVCDHCRIIGQYRMFLNSEFCSHVVQMH